MIDSRKEIHEFVEGEWEILKCGRVAGLRFDSKGTLFAADVALGIFKVNVDTGNEDGIILLQCAFTKQLMVQGLMSE